MGIHTPNFARGLCCNGESNPGTSGDIIEVTLSPLGGYPVSKKKNQAVKA